MKPTITRPSTTTKIHKKVSLFKQMLPLHFYRGCMFSQGSSEH